MAQNKLTKCDFCRYATGSGCTVTPESYYCKEAISELNAYLAEQKRKNSKEFKNRRITNKKIGIYKFLIEILYI